jgi:septal ring-binding cell division protein DamX
LSCNLEKRNKATAATAAATTSSKTTKTKTKTKTTPTTAHTLQLEPSERRQELNGLQHQRRTLGTNRSFYEIKIMDEEQQYRKFKP